MSRLVPNFQIFRRLKKGKFDAYVSTVTFGQKFPKLNSRPGYCLRLSGKQNFEKKNRRSDVTNVSLSLENVRTY